MVPDPWSFEGTCLRRGEARSFGTTALSNYGSAGSSPGGGVGVPWGVNAETCSLLLLLIYIQ
jgi:hypothetical protein